MKVGSAASNIKLDMRTAIVFDGQAEHVLLGHTLVVPIVEQGVPLLLP